MAFGGSGYGGRILSNINAGTYKPTLAPAAPAPVQQAVSTPAGIAPADSGLAAATNTTNAYDEIQRVWAQFGLGSLAPLILQWKQ